MGRSTAHHQTPVRHVPQVLLVNCAHGCHGVQAGCGAWNLPFPARPTPEAAARKPKRSAAARRQGVLLLQRSTTKNNAASGSLTVLSSARAKRPTTPPCVGPVAWASKQALAAKATATSILIVRCTPPRWRLFHHHAPGHLAASLQNRLGRTAAFRKSARTCHPTGTRASFTLLSVPPGPKARVRLYEKAPQREARTSLTDSWCKKLR